ncbi:MAG: hypothetical protein JST14_00630 [Bacteroidetes bacterium]|nr:hypothetical protein [Bacteroidota bacterium]MBS1977663.1 hypothetical protein [Bacteroidota bacterium]
MKFSWLAVLLLAAFSASGQRFPSEYWHEGKAVLEEGDTLRGNIKYDLQSDLIQLDQNNKLESFSARKVVYFEIFDKLSRRYRQFYSLPYATSGAYKAPVFFELLSEGKITLLCRESVEYRTYPSSFYYYGSNTRLVLVYKFFLLTDRGSIEPFLGKRIDLISMMGNKGEEVEKFAKKNKLGVEDRNEFAQIVDYYNSFYK